MRLGIMQPYFFPYLGYFSLIAQSDAWVVFDSAQYTPKTWMNRNRVMRADVGWTWATASVVKGSRSRRIWEIRLVDVEATRRSLLGKLSHYRNKAPYWPLVEGLVEGVFCDLEDDNLSRLNVKGMAAVCAVLEIEFVATVSSERWPELSHMDDPGDWALEISGLLGANEYMNPIAGMHLFDKVKFEKRGIRLLSLQPPDFRYEVGPLRFIRDLSILDVLMWNPPSAVRQVITDTALVERAS
jgi:WbqC-like protein family